MTINLPNKSKTSADPILSGDWYDNDLVLQEALEVTQAELGEIQAAAIPADESIIPSKFALANNAVVTSEELPTPTRSVHSLGGTKSIKTIGTGQNGQLVTYVNTSGTMTFKTGGNLRLASEFAAGVSDSITFAYILNVSQWCEVCRSNNV